MLQMKNPIIECISLSKQYSRNNNLYNVLNNIDLNISSNESLLIKGRSGAGKSTLLNLMSGLIRPTSGKVLIRGKCISQMSNKFLSRFLREDIGIIFQSFNLLPTYNIFENIEIALIPDRGGNIEIRNRIMLYLEQFDLKDKAGQLPAELSVGQQQKVAIIRTLIKNPSIIFADEPTGSVDDITAVEILNHLTELRNSRNVTLVIASHGNIPDSYADRAILIENGQIRI